MKKHLSFKGKRCFNEVFTRGKRFRSKWFQCVVVNDCSIALNGGCDRKEYSSYKIGIVIGRRFGNACERNRAKRRMRAMCDAIAPGFAGDWCMVIRIFDDYRNADFREARDALRNTLARAGLIRELQ